MFGTVTLAIVILSTATKFDSARTMPAVQSIPPSREGGALESMAGCVMAGDFEGDLWDQELLFRSTLASIESPTRSGWAASSSGFRRMRTGRRCTTLIQLPVAFCAGIRAKAAPVPP